MVSATVFVDGGIRSAVVSLLLFISCASSQTSPSVSDAIERKLIGYDKRMRPNFGDSSPVEVQVSLYILDISSVNEDTMDFTVTCYFRQYWKDPRLAGIHIPKWDGRVVQDSDLIDKIWTPDTFFVKDKDTVFHETAQPNSYLKITPEGDIQRSIRISTTTACSMDLRRFPMDTQICSLHLESYGYKANDIIYSWHDGGGVGVLDGFELMRYHFVDHRMTQEYIILQSGNYSRLKVDFHFKRDMGYYVMNLYVPSALIVLLSCLSFWLGPNSTLARGLLTLTCVLAVVVLIAGNDDALPPVSYVRAIDIYFLMCFLFVLFALAQYVAVHHLCPRNSLQCEELEKCNSRRNEDQQQSTFQMDASLIKPMESRAAIADKYGRYIVPILFLVFNFLYWTIYLCTGGIESN